MSVKARINRLFGADGKCFDVAIDHGMFGEARHLAGIENIAAAVSTVVAAGPDAIQLSVGQAHFLQDVPGKNKPALVLRTDVANVYGDRMPSYAYAQIIDDSQEHTLLAVSTLDPSLRPNLAGKTKSQQAAQVGKLLAERALQAGITRVVFDRGGYRYHGRVKALADASREGGLKF